MMQPKTTVPFAGGLLLGALLTLAVAAQEPAAKLDPTQEMLAALIASQERQAIAWENLAEKGWPTPQVNQFSGDLPRHLNVNLSGNLGGHLSGSLTFDPLGGTLQVLTR